MRSTPSLLSGLGLLVLSHLPAVVRAATDAPCYDPKGVFVPSHYPCDPTAFITTCCPQGYACYSNSLCVVVAKSNSYPNLTVGAALRGSCTNPLWANLICGDYCLNEPNLDGRIESCGSDNYCCSGDLDTGACDCASGKGTVKVRPGTPGTIIAVGGQPPATPSIQSASSRTTTLARVTSTSSSSGATPTSRATPTPKPVSDKKPVTKKIGFQVGVALGGLAFLGLIGTGVFFWLRRDRPRSDYGSDASGQPKVVNPVYHNP